MSLAKTPDSTNTPMTGRRRLGAALLAIRAGSMLTSGIAAGVATVAAKPGHTELTPIVAAGMRLAELSALEERGLSDDELDAITEEQCALQARITDTTPESVGDAIVLLMVASYGAGGPALHEDGAFYHERSNILLLRVMHFLATHAEIDLSKIGGTFLLTSDEHQAGALTGSVAQAALRFHRVTPERAWTRREEEDHLAHRRIIRARHGIGYSSPNGPDHDRVVRLADQAATRWNEKCDLDFASLRGTPAQEQGLADRLEIAFQQLRQRAAAGAI